MIYEFTSYRSFLKAVLAERVGKNPSYSLRAMAGHVKLAPSTLSEIFKGKTNLSFTKSLEVATRLGLENLEAEYFSALVAFENAKDPKTKETHLKRVRELSPTSGHQDLSIDAFRVIADWYHLPMLQMLKLHQFKYTPVNIGKRLGISTIEAEAAIERLERLELIEKSVNGNYARTKEALRIYSDLPNTGLRHFHKQMLEKAITSLETQLPSEKIIESVTLAIDPTRLAEAREAIDQMITKVEKLGANLSKNSEVYHLNTIFFNLTKSHDSKREKSK